ncbi:MAG: hypothetical protein Q8K60_04335 [Parachlamydiaceae bacterium]|nr:hypothetical protein [Parachlamydiaceae bacterium]
MPDFEEVYLKWVDKLSREIKYFNYQKNLILDTKEKINQTFIEAIKDLRILNQDGYYYCPISINDYNDPFAEPKVKHFLHEMDFQPLQDYELWKVSIKEHHRGFEFGINHFPPKIYEYIYEVIDSESYKTSPVSIGSFRIMDEPEFHEILQSNNTQSYFINIFKRNFHNMKNLVEKENQKEREKEKEKKTLIKIYRLFSKSI